MQRTWLFVVPLCASAPLKDRAHQIEYARFHSGHATLFIFKVSEGGYVRLSRSGQCRRSVGASGAQKDPICCNDSGAYISIYGAVVHAAAL